MIRQILLIKRKRKWAVRNSIWSCGNIYDIWLVLTVNSKINAPIIPDSQKFCCFSIYLFYFLADWILNLFVEREKNIIILIRTFVSKDFLISVPERGGRWWSRCGRCLSACFRSRCIRTLQHTVHETTVVQEEVADTNAIESFVTKFAIVTANVAVQYLNQRTGMTQISQFALQLQQIDGNWKIVK